jgi:membrane protease YdiL (CAAX protease family)
MPEFDLGLSKLEPSSIEKPSIAPQKRPRSWKANTALIVVIVVLTLLSFSDRKSGSVETLSVRAEKVSDAVRDAKLAFLVAQSVEYKALNRPKIGEKASQEALSRLLKLSVAPEALPNDLRRYAILIGALGKPTSPEIMTTLRGLTRLKPPKTRAKSKRAEEAAQAMEGKTPLSPKEEVALWERIYGTTKWKGTEEEVVRIRQTIEKMDLGWFESLAVAHLYRRAGMNSAANASLAHAKNSAVLLHNTMIVQNLVLLGGILGWIILVVMGISRIALDLKLRRRGWSSPAPNLRDDQQSLPLSYNARVSSFALYLGMPLLMAISLDGLRRYYATLSPVTAMRISSVIYIVESLLVLGVTVGVLRHLHQRQTGEEPTVRHLLTTLGFRAKNPVLLIAHGALGYALVLLPVAYTVFISNYIFRNYTTPPHPISLSFALMKTPLDWAVLIVQTSIMAPLVEETLFRGVLFPALRERWGVIGGIVLSSSIFAVLHPNMPAGFLPLFVLGASMAILYQRTHSLLPGMVFHALTNGFIMLIQIGTIMS